MNPLEYLNSYLHDLEGRLRLGAITRGIAVLAGSALAATVLLVLAANARAFSAGSMTGARAALFLVLALALGFGLLFPLIRLNRKRAARQAEDAFPGFEQRLLTFTETQRTQETEPFLELLADDALKVARHAEPGAVVPAGRLVGFLSAGVVCVLVLLWLITAGPGFLGYGSSLLWAGTARGTDAPFYDIVVTPGDQRVRRGGEQVITAKLVGFDTDNVRLFARFESASKWEEVNMQPIPGDIGFEFLFAGIPESVDYHVEAGAVRTDDFRLDVVDLPVVKQIQVTYRFPKWLGRPDETEKDAGDLRAVEGTEAELAIRTDKPLSRGRLILDDGREVALESDGEWARGTIRISDDGLYHIAALDQQETVRLTQDYFIEAQPEEAPLVSIRRPGRDYRASPIEEVTIEVDAEDDYGLRELNLVYSVNGGPERKISMLDRRGARQAENKAVLYLEDHRLVPGDLVSLYALARDARTASRTDMYFIEAQPYMREYSQSQQSGSAAGGGQQDQNRISPRQKEIISATWNLIKDENRTPQQAAEDGQFLSGVQSKLREQARTLAERMRARELSVTNTEFKSFAENMESAAQAMGEASDKLKGLRWREALVPEQKALQHLLRAESIFRQIQVARGGQGGEGGGGNMGRDLENLFDLELDTEKNQYETGQRASSADQRSREIDEALKKLEQLARRQEALASQQQQQKQSFQQRWQQEMLRREAEELQREMERLTRGSSSQQSASRQQQQQGQSSSSQGDSMGSAGEQRLQQALERLREATEDMRRAGGGQQQQSSAESRRAAERLREASNMVNRLREQESSEQVSDLAERARKLAGDQQIFADELREAYKGHKALGGEGASLEEAPRVSPEEVERLALEKQRMADELARLEKDMQSAVRDLAGSQRPASSKVREALGEMQQRELGLRMRYLSEWISRGLGAYAWLREAPVTEGMNRLAEQLREAEKAVGQESAGQENLETALSRVERLRNQMEQMSRALRQGQQGQQGQQQGSQTGQGGMGQTSAQGQPRQRAQGGSGRTSSAMNTGDRRFPDTGIRAGSPDYEALERTYREGVRDLSGLRRELRENQDLSADVGDLIREMQNLDPARFQGNPELVEQLSAQLLPMLEQIELRLRRELEAEQGGQVRSGLSQEAPAGYADAVAEYFRSLSRQQ